MFSHEARAALLPVEATCVVVNAQHGIEPVTGRVWKYAEEANVPEKALVFHQVNRQVLVTLQQLTEWGR